MKWRFDSSVEQNLTHSCGNLYTYFSRQEEIPCTCNGISARDNNRRTFAGVSSSLFWGKCARKQYLYKIVRLPTQDGRNNFSWSTDREQVATCATMRELDFSNVSFAFHVPRAISVKNSFAIVDFRTWWHYEIGISGFYISDLDSARLKKKDAYRSMLILTH